MSKETMYKAAQKVCDKLNGYSTMTDFEKRTIFSYIIKMLDELAFPEGYELSNFSDSIHSILTEKESKSCPTFDYERNKKTEKKAKAFLDEIKKWLINYVNCAKYKKSNIENKINAISELYSLTKIEIEIFKYLVLKMITPFIKELEEYYYKNCCNDYLTFWCINYLDLKKWQVNKNLRKLTYKGICSNMRLKNDPIELSSRVAELFDRDDIRTKSQIKSFLVGTLQKSSLRWEDFNHIGKDRDIVLNVLKSVVEKKTKGVNILLYGDVGTGKTEFAKLVANKAKIDEFAVLTSYTKTECERKDRINDLCSKQTILLKSENACLLFDEAEDALNYGYSDLGKSSKACMNGLLENTPLPIFWTTNNIDDVDPAFLRRMTYAIEFKKLSDDVRLNIWKRTIKKNKLKINNKKLVELNESYDIPPSMIANAVNTTKLIDGNQEDFEVFVENIAKVVSKKKCVKKKKEFEMKDYNLSLINTDIDIKHLTTQIKKSGKLNFSLCLFGEPGTGKSLYARYLANELGIEVVFKRASDLLSMWVGGTEENIAEAFAEAKSKKAMLIFDEADSFLQNRNNAQRNWKITQVNEMLTWMETHEYPFVCTTNFMETLDEASLRRFTFKIRFDFMSKDSVNSAFEYFYGIKNTNIDIKGLTAGDFATVRKKADFLGINNTQELIKMLEEEVKVKKSKSLQNTVGF